MGRYFESIAVVGEINGEITQIGCNLLGRS